MSILRSISLPDFLLPVVALLVAGPVNAAEINLRGNGLSIPNNDLSPGLADGTLIGMVTLGDGLTPSSTFTIENTDGFLDPALELTGTPRVSVSGPQASEFVVTQPSNTTTTIPGGLSLTFKVTFSPAGGGFRRATVTIPNNDSNESSYSFAILATVNLSLNYSTGVGGSLTGSTTQIVTSGQNGSPVTVTPAPGSSFAAWSDGSIANPRTDTNVTQNLSVTAGYLSYTNTGTRISITDCDEFLTGALTIPTTIDGLPVTSIGNDAFRDCGSLTSITLPAGITSIGPGAFQDCSSLVSVNIPEGVTGDLESRTFLDCDSLTSITLPTGITRIRSSAFAGCSSLSSITLPDGLYSIGADAFYFCSNLRSITIPNSVKDIGPKAFHFCLSLTSVTFQEGASDPDTLFRIGSQAFERCSKLTGITIPIGVTEIEPHTFSGCRSLASVTIPAGVISIGSEAFSDCSSLTSVTIPVGVIRIGFNAFERCSALSSIAIPIGVTEIESRTFYQCNSLTSVTIPAGVTSIGREAFAGCPLTSVTLPAGVIDIGADAFFGCRGLERITIPASVTSIGSNAFGNCPRLSEIHLDGDAPTLGSDVFQFISSTARITVGKPDAAGYVYRSTFGGLPVTGLDPDADPYHTGVSNLLTYTFFGTFRDPATVRPTDLPQVFHEAGALHFEFRPFNLPTVTIGAEWSETLDGDWQALANTSDDFRVFKFSMPVDGGTKFMRLTVIEN